MGIRVALVLLLCIASLSLGNTLVFSAEESHPEEKPAAGKQTRARAEVTVDDVKVSVHYWLFLPADYGKKEQAWPLMLFLHGAGERGDNLEVVKKHGPPKLVDKQPDFPFILVSPQCPSGKRWEPSQLIQLVDQVSKNHKVDSTRVYCTGHSMGGYGTWSLAAAHPTRFAACAPICGGGDVKTAEKLVPVPLWVFHGAKDTAVPLKRSEEMVDAIKAAKGNVKLTVYPEAAHDSWTESYNNPELYKWFLSHQIEPAK